MNVLVIEYEMGMVQKIKDLLNQIDESIQVVGVTDNMFAAAEWLTRNKIPDLILANEGMLDHMPEQNRPDIKTLVKISTNTAEYKFAAFRYKTLRRILHDMHHHEERPINFDQYLDTRPVPAGTFKERFLVKQGQRLLSIPIGQVAYFFSQERFIFLRTFDNQKFLLEYRIEQLEQMLAPGLFFRINRSFIISLPCVKEIHAYFGNRLKLYLSPVADKEVIVSRKRIAEFKQWLGK